MLFKYLRYLAFGLGGVSGGIATGALYIYLTFDGTRLAAELSHFAKQHYQRSLRFEEPIGLSMFPRLELRLPAATLSGSNGEGKILAIQKGVAGLEVLPMLAGRVKITRLEVDGLFLGAKRKKEGQLNLSSLLVPLPDSAPFDVAIEHIDVHHGALTWSDEQSGRSWALSELEVAGGPLLHNKDGHFELGARLIQSAPNTDARLSVDGVYRVDDSGTRSLRGAHLKAKGILPIGNASSPADSQLELSLAEWKAQPGTPHRLSGLALLARLPSGGDTLEVRASTPQWVLDPNAPKTPSAEASLRLDGKTRGGQLRLRADAIGERDGGLASDKLAMDVDWKTAQGRLAGRLDGGARWHTASQVLQIEPLAGALAFTPASANAKGSKIAVTTGARFDFAHTNADGSLQLEAPESQVHAKWSLPRWQPLSAGLELEVDKLDLDRLLGPLDASQPLDVDILKAGDAEGSLRVGKLKLAGMQLERVRVPFTLHDGKLSSPNYSAELYGGSVEGAASLSAADNAVSWRLWLQNAHLAALLKDVSGNDHIASGSLNLFFDLNGTGGAGATPAALRDALSGPARLRVKNTVLHGIDVPTALKEWRPALQARQPAQRTHRPAESVALGELTASFQVSAGHARSQDLANSGAAVGVSGHVDVALNGSSVDAHTRLSLLNLAAADQASLGPLRNVPVPVRTQGPLNQPVWLLEPGAPALAAAPRPAPPPSAPAVRKPLAPAPAKPAAPRPASAETGTAAAESAE